ncbi:MAG: hypothetical protein MET45_29895 [Nostoc sp. LLA-1]|nr:hypothetical protein [Cyanocohniella sp. LLY]
MDDQPQLPSAPDTFINPLLKLREYYAPIVEKYEKLYTEALANLNHVEALLSVWSDNGNLPTLEVMNKPAASNLENLPLEDNDFTPEPKVNLVEPVSSQLSATENSSSFAKQEVVTSVPEGNSDRIIKQPVELVELIDFVPKTSESQQEDDSSESISTDTKTPEESPEKSLSWSEIPMLPQYQSLNRTEAILKVLQKYAGSVCHISLIMRSLYGDLEPEVLKVVKGRVHSSLTHGKESGRWSLIPDEPGCYTLDLKLLNSNGRSSSKQSKNRKLSPVAKTNLIPMIGEFSGQVLIDAISSLLEKNPGKIFTIAEVINGLCGELDGQEFNHIKSKVVKELSRGHRTGRFSRVPEQIGLYTWDSKLLPKGKR